MLPEGLEIRQFGEVIGRNVCDGSWAQCGRGHDKLTLLHTDENAIENLPKPPKIRLCEVRPKFFGYMNLRIAELPEEKIGYPHFSRCPDEEVGIGNPGGIQSGIEKFSGDVILTKQTRGNIVGEGFHGINDFRTTAIVDGQHEMKSGIRGRRLHHLLQLALADGGEFLATTDVVQANTLPHHLIPLLIEKFFQQKHEPVHL